MEWTFRHPVKSLFIVSTVLLVWLVHTCIYIHIYMWVRESAASFYISVCHLKYTHTSVALRGRRGLLSLMTMCLVTTSVLAKWSQLTLSSAALMRNKMGVLWTVVSGLVLTSSGARSDSWNEVLNIPPTHLGEEGEVGHFGKFTYFLSCWQLDVCMLNMKLVG